MGDLSMIGMRSRDDKNQFFENYIYQKTGIMTVLQTVTL